MKLSHRALKVLQEMMGEEGAVFMRDLPINCYEGFDFAERIYKIPWDIVVEEISFEELKKAGCIQLRYETHLMGGTHQQWCMTETGQQALKDAGMETKKGRLSQDDLDWLLGTGRFGQ